ncbi:MAG: hypothetical protein M1833_000232 [Piccolia ochrophora]|nr:MAG: hypothetical protein M1833_000232 [Piccolia ochrophora]
MSTSLPSDEVAEDYKNSLEDLTMNSRYEISNLTVIAKENMDHAQAIARVTENHIRTAPPTRKLPALYVLDSVVKNVGTPYTLFFGRNLYQTFMNAYTLVDGPVRKKLEEMLKTWKEPVPGSLDTRPVFPPDVTRPIENALIRARTAAVQLQQQQSKGQQARTATPYRQTPTPPGGVAGLRNKVAAPMAQSAFSNQQPYGHQQMHASSGSQAASPQPIHYQPYSTPQPASHPLLQNNGYPPQADDIGALNTDIAKLIATARNEFASNPFDQALQQRLKALLDLQTILQSQHLPPDQLRLIRNQVSQLTPELQAAPAFSPPPPPPPQPPAIIPAPQQPNLHDSSSQSQSSLPSTFPTNALAALLASVGQSQAPTPPPPPPAVPSLQPQAQRIQPPTVSSPAPAPAIPASQGSLLDSLRAAGLLQGSVSTPLPVSSTPANLPLPPSVPPRGGSNFSQSSAAPSAPTIRDRSNDVQLNTTSLKIPRPHLISSLYEATSNQCTTCGRRFYASEEGRQKKARHLDWHFRTNLRMADAVKRGQNRSWYVGELDWIKSRDEDQDMPANAVNGSTSATATQEAATKAQNDPKKQWVPAPNDPSLANTSCPICQEKFETIWHDEAQEWVWMDAIRSGGRIYHASCHAEASKDGGTTPARTATPDSLSLGKRKAEVSEQPVPSAKAALTPWQDNESAPMRAKIKREFA